MEIVCQQTEFSQLKADAVVNPANSKGEMDGGLAGAIRSAGGPLIEKEAMEKAPIAVGDALATSAGTLPFRYIIHAPTMEEPAMPTTVEKVRQALLAALMCADGLGVRLLAIPGLGTGVGRLSKSSVAELMVETLRNYETASIRKVILFDRDPLMVEAFRNAVFAERG